VYHPTGRVLTVLELLQSRPGITGPELADRLETDVRTVRRYVAKLQDVGIPVEGSPGRYGGYRLGSGYKLPPLIFSEEEAAAVILGLVGSSWLELDQSQYAVEGALSKITRVLPRDARERVESLASVTVLAPYREGRRPDSGRLMDLTDAIHVSRCVRLEYRPESGNVTNRVVEPYGLVGRQGRWYLVAYCRLRHDYRIFRLDRMKRLTLTEERFSRDDSFDYRAHATEHLETFAGRWPVTVLFQAEPEQVRRRVPTAYGTLSEDPRGVIFEYSSDDMDEEARYLISLMLPFTVIEPPDLRNALLRLSADAARAAQEFP